MFNKNNTFSDYVLYGICGLYLAFSACFTVYFGYIIFSGLFLN